MLCERAQPTTSKHRRTHHRPMKTIILLFVLGLAAARRVTFCFGLAGLGEAACSVLLHRAGRALFEKLVKAREPLGRDVAANRTARFCAVLTVAELALLGELFDVFERAGRIVFI